MKKIKQIIKSIIQQLILDKEGLKNLEFKTREELIATIPENSKVLEIGPFFCPMVKRDQGYDIKYFDVFTPDQLRKRAILLNHPSKDIPTNIDYISPEADLSIVDEKFDFIISSHNIEHHPDLISHLQHIERLLNVNGKFIVIIPDKRLGYDYFFSVSSVADIMEAYIDKHKIHSIKNIIKSSYLQTSTSPRRHFIGLHGKKPNPIDNLDKIKIAIEDYNKSVEHCVYKDYHAWFFTPRSFDDNIKILNKLGYINLNITKLTLPCFGTFEFGAILEKDKK